MGILYQLYDVLYKAFYSEWGFWIAILNLFLVYYTVRQTIRLRRENVEQNRRDKQPYLAFAVNKDRLRYVISNKSANMSFNIFVILKNDNTYKVLEEGYIIGVLPAGEQTELSRDDFLEIDKETLVKKIFKKTVSIRNLVDYLESKNEDCQCIIYDDIFGNRMFSVFYVSSKTFQYDQFSEVGYINNIRNKSINKILN